MPASQPLCQEKGACEVRGVLHRQLLYEEDRPTQRCGGTPVGVDDSTLAAVSTNSDPLQRARIRSMPLFAARRTPYCTVHCTTKMRMTALTPAMTVRDNFDTLSAGFRPKMMHHLLKDSFEK